MGSVEILPHSRYFSCSDKDPIKKEQLIRPPSGYYSMKFLSDCAYLYLLVTAKNEDNLITNKCVTLLTTLSTSLSYNQRQLNLQSFDQCRHSAKRYKQAIIRKVEIRKKFPLQKPRWKTTTTTKTNDCYVLILREHIVSRVSSYFPSRRQVSYPNLIKYYENADKFQTAQKSTQKYKTNRTTTELSPWNDQ